ncbi:MAG TPA: DUF2249 domain-containing protein [Halococcus sp.]|nr:DUF2249 domain-containing protein [Halococcus sp.]
MATEPTTGNTHELDARDIDGEPFSEIMAALDDLDDDDRLILINSFEPEPLYNVLEQRGFRYDTAHVTDDEWRVTIMHA